MKAKTPLHDGDESKKSSKGRRGVWRILRVNKRKAYYGGGEMRQIVNRKRRQSRHLRRHPEDAQAKSQYATKYGAGALTSPTVNPIGRALRRAKRKASKHTNQKRSPNVEVL
jgi:hypothetical protein